MGVGSHDGRDVSTLGDTATGVLGYGRHQVALGLLEDRSDVGVRRHLGHGGGDLGRADRLGHVGVTDLHHRVLGVGADGQG